MDILVSSIGVADKEPGIVISPLNIINFFNTFFYKIEKIYKLIYCSMSKSTKVGTWPDLAA